MWGKSKDSCASCEAKIDTVLEKLQELGERQSGLFTILLGLSAIAQRQPGLNKDYITLLVQAVANAVYVYQGEEAAVQYIDGMTDGTMSIVKTMKEKGLSNTEIKRLLQQMDDAKVKDN